MQFVSNYLATVYLHATVQFSMPSYLEIQSPTYTINITKSYSASQ